MNERELLTKEQLGRLIGVRPGTIGRWSREGKIPRIVISRKIIRYDASAVIAAIRKEAGR